MPLFELVYRDGAPEGLPRVIIADRQTVSEDALWILFDMDHPTRANQARTVYRASAAHLHTVRDHGSPAAPDDEP